MPVTTELFRFEHTFAEQLPELCTPWKAEQSERPELLVLNDELAAQLGVDPDVLRTPEGASILVGNTVPDGANPVAQAYAGHQFGGYAPRLGDGRALLLGEVLDVEGRRHDLHLKGSGRTPFARGGDGRAAMGPMLREYVIGEAMHALGIPTTRALAVVATGEQVAREQLLPGAVLARVASSHLRVGTFQYAAASGGPDLVRRLADHAIGRHHPQAVDAEEPYLALFEAVLDAQAALVAEWMLVGFIHGVMNTDNTTISGETIDYGPCAFMDAFDPATVFSSIDHGGRYAYGNQPAITQWNLARLAETLLPLIDEVGDVAVEKAREVLERYPDRYNAHLATGMSAKLGLDGPDAGVDELADGLFALMHEHGVDHTNGFRSLSSVLRSHADGRSSSANPSPEEIARPAPFATADGFEQWAARWLERVAGPGRDLDAVARHMDRVNPVYVPRNHKVEAALDAATGDDLGPLHLLVEVLRSPFERRPGFESHELPAPTSFGPYRTYCGT